MRVQVVKNLKSGVNLGTGARTNEFHEESTATHALVSVRVEVDELEERLVGGEVTMGAVVEEVAYERNARLQVQSALHVPCQHHVALICDYKMRHFEPREHNTRCVIFVKKKL